MPRLINALGGRLLQGCRDRDVRTVSLGMVERAGNELGFDGSQPLLREANL